MKADGIRPFALSSGTRLGPYEILGPIGNGGMGEVYRARDMRLGREVALKTLSVAMARDPKWVVRLEREARATSSFNHPNIVTVHDVGEAGEHHYIVMELVKGRSIRSFLADGTLSLERLLSLGTQVAEALATAHEKGIVHRDLKPENILVTADGCAKVLDFGLARLMPELLSSRESTRSGAGMLTDPGAVVGTVAYMSPEQAAGRAVDYRSDQFSLGVLLYELATGRRPFDQHTAAETLAAILRDAPPPLGDGRADMPPPLQWLIERCLAKNPQDRYASTRDLARELAALRDQCETLRGPRPKARLSQPPRSETSLVGREAERAALARLLRQPDVRLLTLTGPGGAGKTRLALRVAEDLQDHFGRRVCFASLASARDPARVFPLIAEAFGVRMGGTGLDGAEALASELQRALQAATLLVLDNFEHLTEAGPGVAALLGRVPHLKALVTSRETLHLYAEREFPVSPLGVPDLQRLPPLAELVRIPAVALFAERAAAAVPGFSVTAENSDAIAAICARLDGLPLAIELAAARVKILSPAALRARLDRSLQFLTGGARDLPARQQTLRATIDWSHELLVPEEQRLLRRLAVFMGGCTIEAAEAVCDAHQDLGLDVLDGIASLVSKNLLRRRGTGADEPRFEMLDTVREYALERLAESAEETPTRRAQAAYSLVLAEEGAQEVAGVDAGPWLARFDVEHDNLRASLDYLTAARDAEWATRLATALLPYWRRRELLAEGRERLMGTLALPGATARTRAGALYAASILTGEQGDGATTRMLLEESVALYRGLGDEHAALVALNALAVACQLMGDISASRSHLKEVLREARRLGDGDSLARCLNNLASVAHANGEHADARRLYDQCRAAFESRGDLTGAAWALDQAGDAARDQGDTSGAGALYERSLGIFRELGDAAGVVIALTDLARLAREDRDLERARDRCRQALAIGATGSLRAVTRLLEELASLAAAAGASKRALLLFAAAAGLRARLGWPIAPAERRRVERLMSDQRTALGAGALLAWSQGWRMTPEEALCYASPLE